MGKTLKYGSHDFPAKFGFTRSSGKGPIAVRSHVRKRAAPKAPKAPKAPQKMAVGGMPTPELPTVEVPSPKPPSVVPQMRGRETSGMGSSKDRAMRDAETMRAGLTDEGMGMIDAALNAVNAMTGTGALTAGISNMAEVAMGEEPGTFGGFKNVRGHYAYDGDLIKAVENEQMSEAQAQKVMAERHRQREMAGQRGPGGGAESHTQGNSPGAGPGGRSVRGGGAYGGMGGVGTHGMRKGGLARMAEGGKVTMSKVKKAVDNKVMQHNDYPDAHRNMKPVRARPAFNNKPKFGDE